MASLTESDNLDAISNKDLLVLSLKVASKLVSGKMDLDPSESILLKSQLVNVTFFNGVFSNMLFILITLDVSQLAKGLRSLI